MSKSLSRTDASHFVSPLSAQKRIIDFRVTYREAVEHHFWELRRMEIQL